MKLIHIVMSAFLAAQFSFAIELQIEPSKNETISDDEIQKVIEKAKQKRIIIEKQDAKKVAKENRLLADELLKNLSIPKEEFTNIKLSIEETLSDIYVKQKQDAIEINNEVLESYYKTNPKEFIQDNIAELAVFTFKEFDPAIKFYDSFKQSPDKTEQYAKDNNITHSIQAYEISKLSPIIKDAMIDFEKSDYLTPPLFINKSFMVLHIKSIKLNEKKSYIEHKERIINILKLKTFADTRKKLIEELRGAK